MEIIRITRLELHFLLDYVLLRSRKPPAPCALQSYSWLKSPKNQNRVSRGPRASGPQKPEKIGHFIADFLGIHTTSDNIPRQNPEKSIIVHTNSRNTRMMVDFSGFSGMSSESAKAKGDSGKGTAGRGRQRKTSRQFATRNAILLCQEGRQLRAVRPPSPVHCSEQLGRRRPMRSVLRKSARPIWETHPHACQTPPGSLSE